MNTETEPTTDFIMETPTDLEKSDTVTTPVQCTDSVIMPRRVLGTGV